MATKIFRDVVFFMRKLICSSFWSEKSILCLNVDSVVPSVCNRTFWGLYCVVCMQLSPLYYWHIEASRLQALPPLTFILDSISLKMKILFYTKYPFLASFWACISMLLASLSIPVGLDSSYTHICTEQISVI